MKQKIALGIGGSLRCPAPANIAATKLFFAPMRCAMQKKGANYLASLHNYSIQDIRGENLEPAQSRGDSCLLVSGHQVSWSNWPSPSIRSRSSRQPQIHLIEAIPLWSSSGSAPTTSGDVSSIYVSVAPADSAITVALHPSPLKLLTFALMNFNTTI